MEENEWAFCSLWARETIEIKGCARALANPLLAGDYFFNRASVEGCNDGIVPYEQVARAFWEMGIDCYLYFRSQPPPQGLCVADTMHVLRSEKKRAKEEGEKIIRSVHDGNNNNYARVVECEPAKAMTWVDIFCESFSVPEWKDEVARIVIAANAGKKQQPLDLLLAYRNGAPAGCAALFTMMTEDNDGGDDDNGYGDGPIGLYCLGTVPAQRGRGVARSILDFSKALSEKRGLLLFLQTLESENLVGLYKSAGFVTAYTKSICAVPRRT